MKCTSAVNEGIRPSDRLVDDVTYRRVRHVITENARTLAAADALTTGDLGGFGSLMFQSHESLRGDFEVSSVALDRMVDLARQQEGCIGARMTGAGFGGCAVALVERNRVGAFLTNTASGFPTETCLPASIYVTDPAAGVSAPGMT